jgi:Na+-driven multidrug efflux pump
MDRASLDPRTQRLLEAPIVPTLLRLGAPNVLIMLAQASVGLIETFFVGKQGVALVIHALINVAAVAGGAWFGPIGWPRSVPSGRLAENCCG